METFEHCGIVWNVFTGEKPPIEDHEKVCVMYDDEFQFSSKYFFDCVLKYPKPVNNINWKCEDIVGYRVIT